MRDLLFICHRIPYPPDKGEKIRAWNMIRHLSARFAVHLGCLVDDPADWAHVEALRAQVASLGAFAVDRRRQKIHALLKARPGRPLMPDFYADARLRAWTRATAARTTMALSVAYTAAVAPYVLELPGPKLLDFVDVDSQKWAQYAQGSGFPMRLLWAREARTLLRFETDMAGRFDANLFVSPAEAGAFAALAPSVAGRIDYVENGVDLERFAPDPGLASPYAGPGPRIVFTGHMDYWPNQDAVAWFAADVLPLIRAAVADAQFWVVGANPDARVRALASLPGAQVTGRVADVRPYVAHAHLSVSPLRIARGIQNKVLEAMAMGVPVLASGAAFAGLDAVAGRDLLVADGADAMAAAALSVVRGQHPGLGAAGRAAVAGRYRWEATLSRLDAIIDRLIGG